MATPLEMTPALWAPAARRDAGKQMSVLMVDPSLFTASYDAALSGGLEAQGIRPVWATRRLRRDEEDLMATYATEHVFYPYTDGPLRRTRGLWKAVKGVEHAMGLVRLVRLAEQKKFDCIHIQFAPLPILDRIGMVRMKSRCPVILTVHDIRPFNGRPVSALQRRGYDGVLAAADKLIVHTQDGFDALRRQDVRAERIAIVPHGVLPLIDVAPEPRRDDRRWRVLLFGRLQPYKGLDVLIDALGLIDPVTRARLDVVIAGEAMMHLQPISERAHALGLGQVLTVRPGRMSEVEMAALLRSADVFVFPYRSIDASGLLHQIAELGRWIIASDLGAFRVLLGGAPDAGDLVPPSDAAALASSIVASIGRRPTGLPVSDIPSWSDIGQRTREVYEEVIASRRA